MITLKYLDCNSNSDFLINLFNELEKLIDEKLIWNISNIRLTQKYYGDYSPNGNFESKNNAYDFENKVNKEKKVSIDIEELNNILKDTQAVETINISVKKIKDDVVYIKIIDGDLISIDSSNCIVNKFLLEKYKNYLL